MDTQQKSRSSLVGGVILVMLGLLALAPQLLGGFAFWATFWPFIIIGVGLIFFAGMFAGGPSMAGLAIPGSIVTTVGLMLLVQYWTGRWESWSYGWTLILMAVGLGIYLAGRYSGNEGQRQSGLKVLKLGALLFVIFGAFFGMLFNYLGLSNVILPAALILLGVYLLVTRTGMLSAVRRER